MNNKTMINMNQTLYHIFTLIKARLIILWSLSFLCCSSFFARVLVFYLGTIPIIATFHNTPQQKCGQKTVLLALKGTVCDNFMTN